MLTLAFYQLQELKELKCRHCNIQKINPQVYHLIQHLGELDLGDNQVVYLSAFFLTDSCEKYWHEESNTN